MGEELAAAFDAAVLDLAALPDGRIAAALSSGEVAVVEVGGALRSRRVVHDGWTWSVAPAGGGAVSAGEDGALMQVSAGGAVRRFATTGVPLRAVAAGSHGGAELLADAADGTVFALRVDGSEVFRVQAHAAACTALAVRHGRWLSGGEDGAVHLWEGTQRIATWHGNDFVRSVAFTRGGAVLYGGYDGAIVLCALP